MDYSKVATASMSSTPQPDSSAFADDEPLDEVLVPSKIFLIGRSPLLGDRWKDQFSDCPKVEVILGVDVSDKCRKSRRRLLIHQKYVRYLDSLNFRRSNHLQLIPGKRSNGT
jgi:hypothetical protein